MSVKGIGYNNWSFKETGLFTQLLWDNEKYCQYMVQFSYPCCSPSVSGWTNVSAWEERNSLWWSYVDLITKSKLSLGACNNTKNYRVNYSKSFEKLTIIHVHERPCLTTFPTAKKRVDNTTCWAVWQCGQTMSWVCNVHIINWNLEQKTENKIVKNYGNQDQIPKHSHDFPCLNLINY